LQNAFSAGANFSEGLLGNLFSPSRGLFVYSPVLLFAFSGFAMALRDREQRPLNLTFAAIVAGHSIIIGAASMWWAGHSFGPRFMTDIVPIFCYFVAFNFRLFESGETQTALLTRSGVHAGITLLAFASIAINAQGALRPATMRWNVAPGNIDRDPARAWDWRDPQFARTGAKNAALGDP
jgi:hypothetical protein